MSSFGLIEENIELSYIHLAVLVLSKLNEKFAAYFPQIYWMFHMQLISQRTLNYLRSTY